MGNAQQKDEQLEETKPEQNASAAGTKDKKKKNFVVIFIRERCDQISQALFVVFAVLLMVLSIAVIATAITTSIATKIYNADQSSRLVALIALAVSAAISFTCAIGAATAVFKKNKHLRAISSVFLVMALIQAVICGVSVKVSEEDQVNYSKSLMRSFRRSQIEGNKFGKLWDTTQSDLECCGVYSPEDYRDPRLPFYFPPEVPISCCTNYDRSRSNLVQERERETCRLQKNYYIVGCKDKMVDVFVVTSAMVIVVTAVLIVFEVILTIWGIVLAVKDERTRRNNADSESNNNK